MQRPDAAGLPLSAGVLKYQHPQAFQVWDGPTPLSDIFRLRGPVSDDVPAAELVQVLCDRISSKIDGVVVTYSAEDTSFDIYFPDDTRPGDETFEEFSKAASRDVVVSFRLGELPEDTSYFAELSPSQREGVRAIIDGLQRQFEKLLHAHLKEGLCRLWARDGTPLAKYVEISPDAFAFFSITDWKRGVASGPSGAMLFAIRLAAKETAAVSDNEPFAGNSKPEKFARYVHRRHRFNEPFETVDEMLFAYHRDLGRDRKLPPLISKRSADEGMKMWRAEREKFLQSAQMPQMPPLRDT